MLTAVPAICKEGRIVFANVRMLPKDGTKVVVTFLEDPKKNALRIDPIASLRGHGKGEKLVEKLLQYRKEDLKYEKRIC
ncbi:MAG: hypothetical protein V1749_04175 [Candidatus Desantisbacteria bacterium]